MIEGAGDGAIGPVLLEPQLDAVGDASRHSTEEILTRLETMQRGLDALVREQQRDEEEREESLFAKQIECFLQDAEPEHAKNTQHAQDVELSFYNFCEYVGEKSTSPEDSFGALWSMVQSFDAACLRMHRHSVACK
mmetsp:Transcript_2469/g.4957  ORF Transcript_2469/g.4957 Transcript_2469/m.4957 type:complete len:136 (+) Transcript_2469:125-532(+)